MSFILHLDQAEVSVKSCTKCRH